MKPSPPLHLALAIFAAAATRSSAQLAPQLIFRDTFDTSANSLDVNFQNNLGRQSGSAGVLTYAEAPATAPGGAQNAASQINNADSPGHLRLNPNPAAGFVSISPNHNFIEGGQFSIEFDVDAGLNDPDGASSDWAAVVFGASSQNAFVNGSDGMGILFRHNGDIEVWDGATSIYGGSGDFPGGVPKDQIHIRIEVTTGNFLGGSPATIIMFINGEEVRLNPASLEYVKAGGFRANYVTLEGYAAAPGSWVDTFDNFSITAVPCINASSYLVSSAVGQSNQSVTITIPAQLNATSDVDVTVTSSDPAIAGPAGAPIGALTLHYAAGSSTMQSFNVVTRARGTATLAVAGPGGVCLGGDIIVVVGGSFVANPSFEENSQPIFPGYGPIDRWNQIPGGNIGLNDSAGPFHDNGAVPDRNQVAFAQGNGGIWQTIGGLIPGQPYWLQFRYNVRNCCGGTMSLRVLFGGQQLDNIPNIKPVGGAQDYSYRNVVFVPNSSTGRLEFASAAAGDATLLLDAVTIVPRDTNQVLVANPSFEASGAPASDGVISPALVSGWRGTGIYGVNRSGAGPFADNGTNPDQDNVAFISGVSSLSQTISNLLIGREYKIVYACNASLSQQPVLRVFMGGTLLNEETVSDAGGIANYHVRTNVWMADASSAELRFEQIDDFGNPTVLLDDVQVIGLALPPCETTVSTTGFELFAGQPIGESTVTVNIPAYLSATQSVQVLVISLDPGIAIPTGAVGDRLTLNFPIAGATSMSFGITAFRSGTTTFIVSNLAFCANASFPVRNRTSFVLNPSFENNSQAGVGYGSIDSWIGGSGVNNAAQPFADNGSIPDRGQVAFMQGLAAMSQTLFGLQPNKEYWLQLYLNARNCCGDVPSGSVSFNGVDLTGIAAIPPVGVNPYSFVNLPFTPNSATGELRLASGPTALNGDRTLLVDAVSLVRRDAGQVVIQNPSFEASGVAPFPGYIQPQPMAGWSGLGTYGVNISGVGPFADNGVNPDQDNVAFIQGQGASLSQTVTGLVPGGTYKLAYAYNARSGNNPRITVMIGADMVQDETLTPVGGNNPYPVREFSFTAASASETLIFSQAEAGDQTILIDNVSIAPTILPEVRLNISRFDGATVRLSWRASAVGFVLQSSIAIPGGWADTADPVNIEGNEYAVYVASNSGTRFYRLATAQ